MTTSSYRKATIAATTAGIALALLPASFAFAASSTPSQTETMTTSTTSTTEGTSPVESCGAPNAALVIDNSSRLAPGTKSHDKVVDSYISYIDNLVKYSDSVGSITLFPMFVNPDAGNYYSKTFSLGNSGDIDKLKTIIKNWEFDKPNGDIWEKSNTEISSISQRGERDLYSAVKRVQLVDKDKSFNLMTTITEPDIKTHSNETGETIADVGKDLRGKGVYIKAVMFTDFSFESSTYSSTDTFIAKMTADNPTFNKDFFVSRIDDAKSNLDKALVEHCTNDDFTPNGPGNSTPSSNSTSTTNSSDDSSSQTSTSSSWKDGGKSTTTQQSSSTIPSSTVRDEQPSSSVNSAEFSVSSSDDDSEEDVKGPEVDTGGEVVERGFVGKIKDLFFL